jgi:hypothetical protein
MTSFKISCVQFTPALEVGYGSFVLPEIDLVLKGGKL